MTIVANFLSKVQGIHKTGAATEHSYRSSIEGLLEALAPNVTALNEPKRVACGAPDFLVQREEIIIGHVEAKDLNIDLRNLNDANKLQLDRYRKALSNLIYTNCLEWDFYRDGELITSVSIADLKKNIQAKPSQFEVLENLLRNFISQHPLTITSPKTLAEIMAGKAALIRDVLGNTLAVDEERSIDLITQYDAFRKYLIHDITHADFSDIYAETIAYGMFGARLHDNSSKTFSRQEAANLLPKSNPFLRSLFSYIAGPDLDDRIKWIIDDLAQVFRATDVHKLMEGFGKLTGKNDPFLHFYETFLSEYNPAKRKARGVWYTPEPVVNFIIRAVDNALQTEFGLQHGLADTSKVVIDWDTGQTNKKGKAIIIRKEVHRVQILDPATGTGTFLAEAIKQIAPKIKSTAKGLWSNYIEEDLIPRLHGFELLMASYAMCHMKLDMILTALNYKPSSIPPRLSVYLTNSLEEGEPANQTLPFAQWLSNEVKLANTIKRDMPIMCVIGNPPYSGESSNKSDWIMALMDAYKKEPGGKEKLKERNPKWINDDYVKFIRLGESLIERTGDGVLGFITNHGYLDNPTFRGMRWHLLQTFDTIYVLDLHGNSKKKEVTPNGNADKNVFDIQQGVSILIGIKKKGDKSKKVPTKVFHSDVWGTRDEKYAALDAGPQSICWQKLTPTAPHFNFEPWDHTKSQRYAEGFSTKEFFIEGGTGVVTKRDNLSIHETKAEVWEAVQDMLHKPEAFVRNKYSLPDDVRDWRYEWALKDLRNNPNETKIQPIAYRPFDRRYIYFTGQSRGFVGWPVDKLMRHFILGKNIGLATARSNKNPTPDHFFVTDIMMETKYAESSTQSCVFPLYLYPTDQDLDKTRRVNFDPKLYHRLQTSAKHPKKGIPNEVAVFDYIYGTLYSRNYRNTYSEFLKIDFPRIPWPTNAQSFWDISEKGSRLRRLHLMDPSVVGEAPFPFIGEGDGIVKQARFSDQRVWINETQYFDTAPEISWNFQIGGYQPAQKWLKDRKERKLSFEDVGHYQRILKVLSETEKVMDTIELTLDDEG